MKYVNAAVILSVVAFYFWAIQGQHILYAKTYNGIVIMLVY